MICWLHRYYFKSQPLLNMYWAYWEIILIYTFSSTITLTTTTTTVYFAFPRPHRVRHQLQATWNDCLTLIKQQARHYMDQYLRFHRSDQLILLPTADRTSIVKTLRELRDLAGAGERDGEFREYADEWANTVERLQGQQKGREVTCALCFCFLNMYLLELYKDHKDIYIALFR